ncbi:MAG: transposase [Bdellovibrionales bacterium]|nr:transposase [Bdellovibrionales bacterium]
MNSYPFKHRIRMPISSPFYSIVETECFQTNIFGNYLEGYTTTSAFIEFYNTERIHGSLGDRTPMECLQLHRAGVLNGIKNIRL